MTTIPARLWKLFHKMHPEPVKPKWKPGTFSEQAHGDATNLWLDWGEIEARFSAMISCEAYLSAAEMLVPEGYEVYLRWGEEGVNPCAQFQTQDDLLSAEAPTAAEALVTALEAMENDDAQ